MASLQDNLDRYVARRSTVMGLDSDALAATVCADAMLAIGILMGSSFPDAAAAVSILLETQFPGSAWLFREPAND